MPSRKYSLLSPTGILVAALLLATVVAVTFIVGPTLFSPGPLNAQARATALNGARSHAALAHDCGACHPAPWSSRTMADACSACHADVRRELAAGKGLHGGLVGAATSPTCRGCHPEHNGPTAALTSFDETTFPHQLTGFSLRSHARTYQGAAFACKDCHPKGYSGTFDQAICADCHAAKDASFMSAHIAAYGRDCLACHDGSGRTTVDHSKFAFKLTGKHAGVPCKDCHAGATSPQDFRSTPQDCYSCHAKADEHNGSFGRDCGSCHKTTGWGDVTFNHDVFPLDHGNGGQASTCKTCHPADTAHYTCFGCHAHTTSNVVNEHEGRSLAQLQDCVRCHAGGRGGGD